MATPVKLTSMAKAAGCAAKLNPATLDAVLRKLSQQTDPNALGCSMTIQFVRSASDMTWREVLDRIK